jgi:hypothetical protein
MRIESFWAKGFRSLRDVRLDGLGPFNVLYGPNGSGKSNLLAAMEAWLRLIPIGLETSGMRPFFEQLPPQQALERMRGNLAIADAGAPLRMHDIALHSPRRLITLGGTLADGADVKRVEVELQIDAAAPLRPTLHRMTTVDGVPLEHDNQVSEMQRNKLEALRRVKWERKFSLVGADRMPRAEPRGELPPEGTDPLSWYFRRGQLKNALFAAQNAPSPDTVRALDRFRQFMSGPPLHRPPFRSVEEPHTSLRDLREQIRPPPDEQDISLDFAGLGIAQIYWILAQAMLSGARAVGIEEPEAHLHAPTSGLHLRELLKRLVDEKHIDQLFIATHSNVFDLDETGYWDVRLEDGETKVTKKPLDEIDQHLYEPGPTLHAVEELLKLLKESDPEQVMFRRAGGAPVTAREMLALLRAADPVALEYLGDIHRAAVDVVGLRARRKAAP